MRKSADVYMKKLMRVLSLPTMFLNILRSWPRIICKSERNYLSQRNQLFIKHYIKCINYFFGFFFLQKHNISALFPYKEMSKSNIAKIRYNHITDMSENLQVNSRIFLKFDIVFSDFKFIT